MASLYSAWDRSRSQKKMSEISLCLVTKYLFLVNFTQKNRERSHKKAVKQLFLKPKEGPKKAFLSYFCITQAYRIADFLEKETENLHLQMPLDS